MVEKKYLDYTGLQHYTDKLINHIYTPFYGFIENGQNIYTYISGLSIGSACYCKEGIASSGEDDNNSSKIEINFTQNAKRAVYLKSITIDYLDQDGIAYTYSHSFAKKTFSSANTTETLSGKEFLLTAGIEEGLELYTGYSSEKGHQFGSSSQKATRISLSTTGFAGYTITSVTLEASGASSTRAALQVNVGTSLNYIYAGVTSSNASYNNTSTVELGLDSLDSYKECLIIKNNDGTFTTQIPSSQTLFININNNRLYRYDTSKKTFVEVSQVLELGNKSTTAYRGDYGQSNRDDILNIKRNIKFNYESSTDYSKVTSIDFFDGNIHFDTVFSNDGADLEGGIVEASGLVATTLTTPSSGDTLYVIGDLEFLGGEACFDSNVKMGWNSRLTLQNEPVEDTHAANKLYVDNTKNSILDEVSSLIDGVSGEIDSENSRAVSAERDLQDQIDGINLTDLTNGGTITGDITLYATSVDDNGEKEVLDYRYTTFTGESIGQESLTEQGKPDWNYWIIGSDPFDADVSGVQAYCGRFERVTGKELEPVELPSGFFIKASSDAKFPEIKLARLNDIYLDTLADATTYTTISCGDFSHMTPEDALWNRWTLGSDPFDADSSGLGVGSVHTKIISDDLSNLGWPSDHKLQLYSQGYWFDLPTNSITNTDSSIRTIATLSHLKPFILPATWTTGATLTKEEVENIVFNYPRLVYNGKVLQLTSYTENSSIVLENVSSSFSNGILTINNHTSLILAANPAGTQYSLTIYEN